MGISSIDTLIDGKYSLSTPRVKVGDIIVDNHKEIFYVREIRDGVAWVVHMSYTAPRNNGQVFEWPHGEQYSILATETRH